MARTAKQLIEFLETMDPDQMVIWQAYTQEDFDLGNSFFVSKENWEEFVETEPYPNWSCPYEAIEEQLTDFMNQKQADCDHAEVKHTDASAHLAHCVSCQFEFDCECKEWEG